MCNILRNLHIYKIKVKLQIKYKLNENPKQSKH